MNSAVSGSNMLSSLLPSATGNGRSNPSMSALFDGKAIDFKDIISGELLTPEGMAKLQDLLPPEQFSELESLLENGNGLPFSADLADSAPLLNNPSVLQWMLQLAGPDGMGEEVAAALGVSTSSGGGVTVAELRGMLLRQQGGGNPVSEQVGQPLKPVDSQTPLLLAKGEIPSDIGALRSPLLAADLATGSLLGTAPGSVVPLASAVSGLEQLAPQRSEVYTPPTITVPTGEKGWDNVLSNRIMWMVGNQMQQASVHITPRHLGPIDIQVSIQNDQTNVSFMAQNAVVKEALEAAIPRLREIFADNNMQLVNVDVGQRDASGQAGAGDLFQQMGAEGNRFTASGQPGGADDSPEALEPVRIMTSSGLVDDYA